MVHFQYPHTVMLIIMHKGSSHLGSMALELCLEFGDTGRILLLHKHPPACATAVSAHRTRDCVLSPLLSAPPHPPNKLASCLIKKA